VRVPAAHGGPDFAVKIVEKIMSSTSAKYQLAAIDITYMDSYLYMMERGLVVPYN
jgi:hypothetical protein